jgi:8-oxo-dGTP pyrophosphatase MutT (NUDIX family)
MLMALNTGRFLLSQRSPDSPAPNTWAPWGGKCEYGEYPDDAARRELHEESGFLYDGPLDHLHHYELKGHEFDTFLAITPNEFEPVLGDETQDSRWVDIDELPEPLHDGLADLMSSHTARKLLYRAVSGMSGRPCKLF